MLSHILVLLSFWALNRVARNCSEKSRLIEQIERLLWKTWRTSNGNSCKSKSANIISLSDGFKLDDCTVTLALVDWTWFCSLTF
jgi:hypothetical protein